LEVLGPLKATLFIKFLPLLSFLSIVETIGGRKKKTTYQIPVPNRPITQAMSQAHNRRLLAWPELGPIGIQFKFKGR